ncbi:MAG: hypothetical protein ABI556_12860 [Gemmatimonadales bacterium]
MRRLFQAGCIAIVAVAVFAGSASRIEAQVGPYVGKQVNVAVDIRCLAGNGVQFSLTPWAVQIAQGDSVSWVLSPDAGVPEITITPKVPTKWPYDDAGPYKGNAAKGPKVKKMKNNVKVGDRYSYNVSGVCTRADGTTSNVVIDPDMIIIGGK